MKALYVRDLSAQERESLQKGLQSKAAFTTRRCQILLASAQGLKAGQIARQLHCSDETVRAGIHRFHQEGLDCLTEKSHRPHSARFSFTPGGLMRLQDIVATSPRAYGQEHSLWSLERLAIVCYQEGLTAQPVSYETMRDALQRTGINWKRARKRMQSNDAAYAIKKNIARNS